MLFGKLWALPLLNFTVDPFRWIIGLVLIAIALTSPIAYYLMSRWLNDFVYCVDLSLWISMFSGTCTILMALLTISIQGGNIKSKSCSQLEV